MFWVILIIMAAISLVEFGLGFAMGREAGRKEVLTTDDAAH